MTATGSQGPISSFTDPQGIIAGFIERNLALPVQVFSGALGDTKNLTMTMPFKQLTRQVDYSTLIPLE